MLVHATTLLKGSRVAPPQSDVTPLPLTTPLMKNSSPAGWVGEQVLLFLFAFFAPCAAANTKYQFPCLVLCLPRLVNTFFYACVYTLRGGARCSFARQRFSPPSNAKSPPFVLSKRLGDVDSEAFPMFAHSGGLKEPRARFSCNFGFQSS